MYMPGAWHYVQNDSAITHNIAVRLQVVIATICLCVEGWLFAGGKFTRLYSHLHKIDRVVHANSKLANR